MIPKDKLLHFAAGLALALASLLPLWYLHYPLYLCIMLPIIMGQLKELVWDKMLGNGTAEWLDFLATVAGGVVAMAGVLLW